jgi:Undecaprenyl-phosphate galactose phosphotransferase WbaP
MGTRTSDLRLAPASLALAQRYRDAARTAISPTSGWPVVALLALSDLASISMAVAFSGTVWSDARLPFYLSLWPLLPLFLTAYAVAGLYPGIAIHPVEELRRASISTTLVYLLLLAITFLLKRDVAAYSRAVFLLAWAQSLVLFPLARGTARKLFAKKVWWGFPAVVLGAGTMGKHVVRALKRRPELGLNPVAVLDDQPDLPETIDGVPAMGAIALGPVLAREFRIRYAIVAMPEISHDELLDVLSRCGEAFPHLLLIPNLFDYSSLWVEPTDLGGVLGLEIRQQLLQPGARLLKFLLDFVLAAVGGLLALPLVGVAGILIKCTSKGPVCYGHTRVGLGGRQFKAWKFRTMVQDADKALQRHLDKNPQLRLEWEQNQKLRHDPRVTCIGKLLRKTSLDELPQLWNVLRGEMSLVGPRPIVENEIPRYGGKFALYHKVKPGITGLWQVSGRSDTGYEERVRLDAYYVRNWSVWLDIYVLARTFEAVFLRSGAY